MTRDGPPEASFVVPARNEADFLPATLRSIRDLETGRSYEVIVVDGGSDDATAEIARSFGATVLRQDGRGIGSARHRGAERASGEWFAFVDADTTVAPGYLEAMRSFVDREGLVAATSRCRMPGVRRARVMEAAINHGLSRLGVPVLPGFNCFVDRDAYVATGGFRDVPNEDTDFSRRLGRYGPTAYHPDALVETSPRRIRRSGLSGTLYHYLALDWGRYGTNREE